MKEKNKSREKFIFGAILIWIFLIISTYYVAHKPISAQQFVMCLKSGTFLAVSFIVVSIAGGVGNYLLNKMKLESRSRFVLEIALGLGVSSLGVFLMGISLGYSSWILGVSTIVLGYAARKNILDFWYKIADAVAGVLQTGLFAKILIGFIAFIFLVTAFTALNPPVKFDTLVYHFAIPKKYLLQGGFTYLPENIFWGMPQIGEMLSTWAMALGGYQTALVTLWMIGVITNIGLFSIIRDRIGKTAGLVAVASLLAGFSTAHSLSWGYSGWLNLLFGSAFLLSFLLWTELSNGGGAESLKGISKIQRTKYLVLAGTFTGTAVGVKYTSGILLLIGIVLILWEYRFKPSPVSFKALGIFIISSLFFISPWIGKNVIVTGNPVYPFIKSAGEMSAFRLQLYQSMDSQRVWWEIFLLPLKFTLTGKEGGPGFAATIGPLVLALGAVGVIRIRENGENSRALTLAVITGGVGLVVWAAASRLSDYLLQTRLYYSIFPALAYMVGAGFDDLKRYRWNKIRLLQIGRGLILMVLAFSIFHLGTFIIKTKAPQSFFTVTKREDYLRTNLGWYIPAMEAINKLPDSSTVMMIWEPRGLYCLPGCDSDEILDHWFVAYDKNHNAVDIINSWKEQGYSHILINNFGADYIRETQPALNDSSWEEFEKVKTVLDLVEEIGGGYELYRLGEQ